MDEAFDFSRFRTNQLQGICHLAQICLVIRDEFVERHVRQKSPGSDAVTSGHWKLIAVRVGFAVSTEEQNAVVGVIHHSSDTSRVMNAEFEAVAQSVVQIFPAKEVNTVHPPLLTDEKCSARNLSTHWMEYSRNLVASQTSKMVDNDEFHIAEQKRKMPGNFFLV